jgi:hypothetical protein
MVVRSIDRDKDLFRPKDDDEEILGLAFPYLSAIGALMYLANCTRPDISFAVNLLARYITSPTKRHWVGVKNILRYLQGTKDLGFCSIRKIKKEAWWGIAMLDTYQIPIMPDRRLDL